MSIGYLGSLLPRVIRNLFIKLAFLSLHGEALTDNICKNKTVTGSNTSTNLDQAVDSVLVQDHKCGAADCATISSTTPSTNWLTIDLGTTYNLQTIIFLTEDS